ANRLAQPTIAPIPSTLHQRGSDEVFAEAEVLPITSAELSLASTGVVSEVLVSAGDLVSKNQVLLRLDASAEAARLKQAQASLDRAKASHASALASAQAARNAGSADGAIAEANGQVALADIAVAEAALQRAQARLAADELRAPFAGTVVGVYIRPGET